MATIERTKIMAQVKRDNIVQALKDLAADAAREAENIARHYPTTTFTRRAAEVDRLLAELDGMLTVLAAWEADAEA